jgi:hypothetical protein
MNHLTFICYAGVLIASFASKTRGFLTNLTKGSDIFNEIEALREKPPIVKYKIECYHMSGPIGKRKRAVSHRAETNYRF